MLRFAALAILALTALGPESLRAEREAAPWAPALLGWIPDLGQDGTSPAQRVHRRIGPNFNRPQDVDAETLAAARTSPIFGARYAAALAQLHKAAEQGTEWEAAWLAISSLGTQGGPAGTAEHLKALAAALKNAVLCKA